MNGLRAALVAVALPACAPGPEAAPARDALPPGFPAIRVPEENPITAGKAELGRHLFHDARLSGNGRLACSGCHQQARAFADARPASLGSTGERHRRNAPSLANVAWNATLTWANPHLAVLEDQLLLPIFGRHPVELGATGREDEILERLAADERYRRLFEAAFPEDPTPITWPNVVRALATFVRTLVSGNAPIDRFLHRDEADALSPAALRGMELYFSDELECHHCHGGFNFAGSSVHAGSAFVAARFHNTGLYDLDGAGAYPPEDTGLFEVTGRPEDMGRFRPPSLRNVAVTAPYMHDGSVATLEEVIRFYEAGGRSIADGPNAGDGRASPLKSAFVDGFSLTDRDRADLLAFLESLTDADFLEDPRHADPFAGDGR